VNALELKVPPLVLVLLLAVAMWFVARQLPSSSIFVPWHHFLAATISCFGILFVLAGGYAFRKAKTTVNPTKPIATSSIVSSGVYRLSRNPMYVGALLALAGWAVFLSNAVPFLFLPAFVMYMNRFQILPEERALSSKFGTEYETYKQSVRRWL
jgi:protein-S-isoprenylcysteine O-methyltransferase Ste14